MHKDKLQGIHTGFTTPSIAVNMSCLNKCMQKSASSSRAKFLSIPHPATLVSKLESVRVCSNKTRTICSRRSSFRHLVSSIRFVITFAAADLVLMSGDCKSAIHGRIFCSRIAASSGSVGGFIGFATGFARFFCLFLGLDLPILVSFRGRSRGVDVVCYYQARKKYYFRVELFTPP